MSITGRFEADFQSFYAAVDKADAKLTDFQSGAGRVETSLNKMVDSFSGRRLIQEATLAAEAIERIGGTSKLTESELEKVAVKASEAASKLKAMGAEVPSGIASIASELKPVHEEMGLITEQAVDLGKKFIAAFAVEKLIEFALEVGKTQQQLTRLSVETQINISDLQDLTNATSEYGLSNEELAKSLFNVSKGIAGGDESVARGLHEAGLSLDELQGKHGKELFLEIEGGLSKLQGSLRDTAAADIFGSKLGAAMAGFSREAKEAIEKAEQFNIKLSPEETAKLKKYADEVEHVERNFKKFKDKALAEAIPAMHEVGALFREGTARVYDFFAALGLGSGNNLKDLHENLAKAADEQKRLNDGVKEEVEERSKESQALQFLAALRTDSAKELEGYQRRGLEELRDMGQLNQANASAIGVSVDQFKRYTEEVRSAEVATKALTAATAEQSAQLAKIQGQVTETITKQRGTQTEIELAGIKQSEDAEILSAQRRADALKANLVQQHADTKENLAKIDADTAAATDKIHGYFNQLRDGVGVDWNEIKTHGQAALDDLADRAKKTYLAALQDTSLTKEEVDKLAQKWRDAEFAATRAGRAQVDGQRRATASVEETNKKLTEQWDKQEKIRQQQLAVGGATTFTAANFESTYTAPAGLSKTSILALLKQGFSIQNAVDILYAQAKGVGLDLAKWPEEARGPRVPGFKYGVENYQGGTAVVGEDGPELVKLPPGSSVLPMRGGRGGGGSGTTIHAPVYVSGVFDPSSSHALSRVVSGGLLRSVANARVLN